MAQSRFYSSTAQPTVLTSALTPSDTTIDVQQVIGFPPSFPYILAVDYGTPSEELVLVTTGAGTNLTVTRAYDGTSGTNHDVGAAVRHVISAIDETDSRVHEGSSSGIHGVSGDVVGTSGLQTLTQKTLTSPAINGGTITNPAITGTVTGGATYATATLSNPTLTGTVTLPSGATIPSPTITGTVAGSATYTTPALTAPTANDMIVNNSAVGVIPLKVNALSSTSVDLFSVQSNGTDRFRVSSNGVVVLSLPNTATNMFFGNAATGFTGGLVDVQVNSVSQFNVNQAGNVIYKGSLTGGSSGQFTVSSAGAVASTGVFTNFKSSEAESTSSSTTTSTTYTDLASGAFSATITVPPSGVVMIDFRATGRNSGANNTLTSIRASGSTSGTVYTENDTAAVVAVGTNNISLSGKKRLSGLVSGETLTVTMKHRVNSASTATFDYRTIHLQAIGSN